MKTAVYKRLSITIDDMHRSLMEIAETKGLSETLRAIDYAMEKHKDQQRKPFLSEVLEAQKGNFYGRDIEYIVHPYTMALHAFSLGIEDDEVLATALLHDVCEDCGVLPEELPFSGKVREAVALLTKPENREEFSNDEYYAKIAGNPAASIVKALDRCNNISTMTASFEREKLEEYIEETEQYVYPLLMTINEDYPQYRRAAFALMYHTLSVLESIKAGIARINALMAAGKDS